MIEGRTNTAVNILLTNIFSNLGDIQLTLSSRAKWECYGVAISRGNCNQYTVNFNEWFMLMKRFML